MLQAPQFLVCNIPLDALVYQFVLRNIPPDTGLYVSKLLLELTLIRDHVLQLPSVFSCCNIEHVCHVLAAAFRFYHFIISNLCGILKITI